MTDRENFDAAREARADALARAKRTKRFPDSVRRLLDAALYRDTHQRTVRKLRGKPTTNKPEQKDGKRSHEA